MPVGRNIPTELYGGFSNWHALTLKMCNFELIWNVGVLLFCFAFFLEISDRTKFSVRWHFFLNFFLKNPIRWSGPLSSKTRLLEQWDTPHTHTNLFLSTPYPVSPSSSHYRRALRSSDILRSSLEISPFTASTGRCIRCSTKKIIIFEMSNRTQCYWREHWIAIKRWWFSWCYIECFVPDIRRLPSPTPLARFPMAVSLCRNVSDKREIPSKPAGLGDFFLQSFSVGFSIIKSFFWFNTKFICCSHM